MMHKVWGKQVIDPINVVLVFECLGKLSHYLFVFFNHVNSLPGVHVRPPKETNVYLIENMGFRSLFSDLKLSGYAACLLALVEGRQIVLIYLARYRANLSAICPQPPS